MEVFLYLFSMRYQKIIFVLFLISCSIACTQNAKKINGVSLVSENKELNENHVRDLTTSNANYVAVIPYAFTKGLSDSNLKYSYSNQWYGERIDGVKQYVTELRKANLKIMLKPQIWVWGGVYTGKINFQSEKKWKEFETTYTNYILTYAKLASELHVELLCIGTELDNFVRVRPNYWIDLIVQLRKVYQGKLTYASNWDTYDEVSFWKGLDFIGVDAYFPLSSEETPELSTLKKSWKSIVATLRAKSEQVRVPVLFTEYGYRSRNYTANEPWQTSHDGKVNLEGQKVSYKALYESLWGASWFAGGFVWKWFPNTKNSGGVSDNRFTPQNKPALKIIQKYYDIYK